jgi:peroxiredoxin Q/BCP
MPVTEGKKAPALALVDAKGKKVTLADFAGKDVILYFYPKDNTPGCTKEACGFRDLWSDISKRRAIVVGVSPDNADSHETFKSQHRLPFTLLSDPSKKAMRAYGAYGEKTMYGKKTEGVIRSTVWIGPDGIVRKHWKRVADAEEHPARVLEALEQE